MACILVVIDDSENRAAVRDAIASLSSHKLVEAPDGVAALRLVEKGGVDLVLARTHGQGMDSFELCRRLRANDKTATVPVVLLATAQSPVENRLRGLDMGAADFIVRPVEPLELLARVGSVLRSKALADEVRRHNIELASKVLERTRQLEELAGELRAERDALRETFNVIEDGLLLLDASGHVQIENNALCRMRGEPDSTRLPSGERLLLTGDHVEAGADPSMREMLAVLARDAAAKKATQGRTFSLRGRQFEARAYPAAGRRVLLYVRDVTEDRDREVRRLQSEKLASIGMLAAGVAHEINNPASFVLANLEALAELLQASGNKSKTEPGAVQKLGSSEVLFEAMNIVQESKEGMARIHRIVRDLHAFSRVDDDATLLTDVNAAVDSSLTMLRSELRYRAQVERDLRATRRVRSSAARLGQVFINLLMNAAHALAAGNPKRNRLYVRSYDEGDRVVVEVEDNGPGIPSEVMPRIFESFFTTKPPGVGTGLGLPISRDIVSSAGGELTAESVPGRGALFRVRLPAAAAGVIVPPKTLPSHKAVQRRRLLAVDDEALLLKAYRRMLLSHHDVETMLGAKEALRLFGQDRAFDVVLCDLQMPEMSGSELYETVRQRWPELAQRFIFITGGACSQEARRFLESPGLACIKKPFQMAELLELIESHAAGNREAAHP
ncbi:MAG TPA: response regulator [Polyangia bacterium]|nr:response regulator [Polyangia bacterium]